jgi:hypothetical protein
MCVCLLCDVLKSGFNSNAQGSECYSPINKNPLNLLLTSLYRTSWQQTGAAEITLCTQNYVHALERDATDLSDGDIKTGLSEWAV